MLIHFICTFPILSITRQWKSILQTRISICMYVRRYIFMIPVPESTVPHHPSLPIQSCCIGPICDGKNPKYDANYTGCKAILMLRIFPSYHMDRRLPMPIKSKAQNSDWMMCESIGAQLTIKTDRNQFGMNYQACIALRNLKVKSPITSRDNLFGFDKCNPMQCMP